MASKTQAQRFINVINQQIDILKGERKTVLEAVDGAINQVQSEVDAWVNGGIVNQTTCAQMNIRIQQVINLVIVKSAEISASKDFIVPETSSKMEEFPERTMFSREETLDKSGVDTPYITHTRFAKLEEAVTSLEKTTEQIQEKQENVKKILEILTNENFKPKTKIQERLTALEKSSQDISLNVDDLFETLENVDIQLKRLEDENKSGSISVNELNKEIGSVRRSSNDVIVSLQDLSKNVESTNQHYNEMSNKMNQLEISIDLMSTQYTEQLENMSSLNKDKVDDLIGMVCQLISKRLAPLETLHETLNKKVIVSKMHMSKVEAFDSQLAEMSGKVTQIENKCNKPTLLFNAFKSVNVSRGCFSLKEFTDVSTNCGGHFDPSSGEFTAPLYGFYLVSVHVIRSTKGSFNVKCFQKLINVPVRFGSSRQQLCCVSDDECVTCLVELGAGDELLLKFKTNVNNPSGLIRIQFSCFMIK